MDFLQESSTKMFCNMCLRKNQAEYACNKCIKFLCNDCKKAHENMVCFQNHHLESLNLNGATANGIAAIANDCLFDELYVMPRSQDLNGSKMNGEAAALLPVDMLCNEIVKILSNKDLNPNEIDNTPTTPSPVRSECSGSSQQPLPDPDITQNSLIPNINERNSNIQQTIHRLQVFKTFGQRGSGRGQFNSPHGLCLGLDDDIVVADSLNHRIQIFDRDGNYKMEFGKMGRIDGYLWHPRKIAVLRVTRKYVVCDRGYERSRLQVFDYRGVFCQKINISFIEIVAGITITEDQRIVLVDSVTPTIFILNLDESLRTIDCRNFINEPSDIVAKNTLLYVCDFKGHSVVVVDFDGNFIRKIGRDHVTNYPNGIDLFGGNILIGDSHGNYFHVTIFKEDGEFIAEMRCPFVKASRCCGLGFISNGRIVTVDKNYHHVIIIDTLRFE